MAKKKPTAKPPHNETIHFRPGHELGKIVSELAEAWDTSRGDAVKRLACLSVHGLDIQFHDVVADLADCMYGSADFDVASHQIHVAIVEYNGKKKQSELTAQERLEIAKDHVSDYRKLRGLEKSARSKTLTVSITQKRSRDE